MVIAVSVTNIPIFLCLQVLREVIEGQMDLLKSTMTKDQDTASQSDRADKSDTKYSARLIFD